MASTIALAAQFLRFVVNYRLFICVPCQNGVRRQHLRTHFQKQHHLQGEDLRTLLEYVDREMRNITEPRDEIIPDSVNQPIPDLPVYSDGLLCHIDLRLCGYICRREHDMKKHYRQKHQWSQFTHRGRPSSSVRRREAEEGSKPWKEVSCQRVFPAGPGSQYFEVKSTRPADAGHVNDDIFWQRIQDARTDTRQAILNTIREADIHESTPWLLRTGWLTYLHGFERSALLTRVDEPEPGEVSVEGTIWQAVKDLLRLSEVAATKEAGLFIRLEAVRTHHEASSQRPLQPYQHPSSLAKSTRYWQQIIMFFVRTQSRPDQAHPSYSFTADQQNAFDVLIEQAHAAARTQQQHHDGSSEDGSDTSADPVTLTSLQRAGLGFCIALLNQQARTNEYECALLAPLAILGLTQDGWKGPDQYTSLLSAVIKTARYLVVQRALLHDTTSEPSVSTSPLSYVSEMMNAFMLRGTVGPFHWMLELRAYGMNVNFQTTAPGRIDWIGDQILYRDLQISMPEFRSFVHGLTHETQTILEQDLLFQRTTPEPLPVVDLRRLRDNPSNSQPGWNFLRDPRSVFPVSGDQWLLRRVRTQADLCTQFFPDQNVRTPTQTVHDYVHTVDAFRTKLWVLVHITGGQPARGTELLAVRHQNASAGARRNIFLDNGLVTLVSDYHKGYNTSGRLKIIHRFIPAEISLLIVRYLWLILPFYEQLTVYYYPDRTLSDFLWPNLVDTTYSSTVVRTALQRESRLRLGQTLDLQSYRHIAIGISRRYLQQEYSFPAASSGPEDEAHPETDDILDLQAAHTSHVAGAVYARGLQEMPQTLWTQRDHFRRASVQWHHFLQFDSVQNDAQTVRHKRQASSLDHDVGRRRWLAFRTIRPIMLLHRLYGEHSQFRPMQGETLDAILHGHSPILSILPTGGGKSLFFFLPAMYEGGGTSIVVVPLIALRRDLVRRAHECQISCQEWNPSHPPDHSPLVFVTPEAASTESFHAFLTRLRTTQQLDRIYFDECHVLLDQASTFRPKLMALKQFTLLETQLIFLTATLPPSRESEFWSLLQLTSARPSVFRTSTTRHNIHYRVVESVPSGLVLFIRRKVAAVTVGKIIIYCVSIRTTQHLAQELGYPAFYREADHKEETLRQFQAGEARTIIATSALGMGVDISDVRLVLHVEAPRTPIEYLQESGRAGRDGQRSESVIVRSPGSSVEDPWIQQYLSLSPPVCRRTLIDQYTDGVDGRTRCSAEEALCDHCEHAQALTRPREESVQRTELDWVQQSRERRFIRTQALQETREVAQEQEDQRQAITNLFHICLLCFVTLRQRHAISACDHVLRTQWNEQVRMIRSTIRFDRYAACWACGFPQAWCGKFEQREGGWFPTKSGHCQYPGLVFEAAAIFLWEHEGIKVVREAALKRIGVRVLSDSGEVVRRLGRKIQWNGVEGSVLIREICSLYSQI
jgi:superfamily II DNA helicase RecQ